MRLKFIRVIAVFVFLFLCASLHADERYPYIGTVTVKSVNVRAKPKMSGEVMCQVMKGQEVTVYSENDKWAKIKLPEKASVWIFGSFVKRNKVAANTAYVRSAPGYKFTPVCKLKRGDKVKIKRRLGDWLRVVPPKGSIGYMGKKYVRYYSTVSGYAGKMQREKDGEIAYREAEQFREKILSEGDELWRYEAVRSKYFLIVEKYPDIKETSLARERIGELNKEIFKLREMKETKITQDQKFKHIPLK
ncbi:MAG: SH3 domain-containing protein [Candidatus Ancaeobacter aquaticus]|nr:SH3 domain-containing protein [Candidatus Ancaeobacter aquaticus]